MQTKLKLLYQMMMCQTPKINAITLRGIPTDPLAPERSPRIPMEVLHQVSLSRFLTIQELGRLLLMTSVSMHESLGTDLVWKLLCCCQWQNSTLIPPHVIYKRGYHWLFRQRANILREPDRIRESCRPCPSVLRAPQLMANELIMLISVFNSKQQEIVSISLEGEELESFLQTGEMNISLVDPVKLGFHPFDKENGMFDFSIMFCSDFNDWRASIHLLRTDNYQCAVIHETRKCSWGEYDYCEEPCTNNISNGPAVKMALPLSHEEASHLAKTTATKISPIEVDMGYLEFSTGGQGFDLSVVGEAFLERIRQEERYADDRLETIKMEPTLLCFTNDFDENNQYMELSFSELRLDVWKTYRGGSAMLFNSRFESEKRIHGVTLLHLLDQLHWWDE